MKNLSITMITTALLVLSLSSCRECEICTKESAPEVRICDKDYDSKTEYGLSIDALELNGYNCR